ncbi:MAG: PRC-barrel domain-containing protein [Nevskiales bacterium]
MQMSASLRLACAAVALMTLSACAGHSTRDDSDTGTAQAPAPLTMVQPQPPPTDEVPADTADLPGSPDTATGTTAQPAAPVTQGRPYAFVCVPYDDRPKPPPRKTVRKDTPAPTPPPVQPAPAPAEVLTDDKAGGPAMISILGKKVFGRNGDDMGRVVDVLAGRDGRPRAAVIDFGGFLGVGNRKVAVDWQTLQIQPANVDKPVILSLSREQINAAPEFKESDHPEQVIVSDPAAKAATTPH